MMKFSLLKTGKIILLILILSLAGLLRFYKITDSPASLSWDEVSVGYNAWSVVNYGRDEWGEKFPVAFKAFEEVKNPTDIYITALFTKLLGLNIFATRFPAAAFGVLNVFLLFLLSRLLFKKDLLALASAFLLAVSPYNIHFSRFNHELNIALSFFLLGLLFFYQSISGKKWLLLLSFSSFFFSLISYNAAKIVVPITLVFLVGLNIKKILIDKSVLIALVFLNIFFISILVSNKSLLGVSRYQQTAISSRDIQATYLYQQTGNDFLGRMNFIGEQYIKHFDPAFLFKSGDQNPKLSPQQAGEFYPIEGFFVSIGLFVLILKKSKIAATLLIWFLIAPIPSSIASEAPHAGRAMFLNGSWQIIAATGMFTFFKVLRFLPLKLVGICVLVVYLSYSSFVFLDKYISVYTPKYAIEWQYGMKEIGEFIAQNPQYGWVYMSAVRNQPYIFFLYFLKIPPARFLDTVEYNTSSRRSANMVLFFDKYHFGDWDVVESQPSSGVLYILTPSEYDGLRLKSSFAIKKLIKYPDGGDAFYIISTK